MSTFGAFDSEGPGMVRLRCKCGVDCVRSLLHPDHRWVHHDDTITIRDGHFVPNPQYDHEPVLDVIDVRSWVAGEPPPSAPAEPPTSPLPRSPFYR